MKKKKTGSDTFANAQRGSATPRPAQRTHSENRERGTQKIQKGGKAFGNVLKVRKGGARGHQNKKSKTRLQSKEPT